MPTPLSRSDLPRWERGAEAALPALLGRGGAHEDEDAEVALLPAHEPGVRDVALHERLCSY